MLSSWLMKLAKCLLVALALWMPTASFAAAIASPRAEQQAPCDETTPEESSESRAEEDTMFLSSSVAPRSIVSAHTVETESHHPLDGHIAELLIPPPNPAAL